MTASWLEISRAALEHNFRALAGLANGAKVAPVVKANAYGHGARLCAEVFASLGADFLCVNEPDEAAALVDLGVPIYVLGPTFASDAEQIAALGCHVVSSSTAHVDALAAAGRAAQVDVPVHIKFETGTNRQGLLPNDALALAAHVAATAGVRLAGATTHLADVEDETEHTFARVQIRRFVEATANMAPTVLKHCAASAAHMLLPESRLDLVRPGIASYGLWPSPETQIAAEIVHDGALELMPALNWKTRIAQLKQAARGEYVGYGRTRRLSALTRVAVLPIGYYDGYDRGLSGQGRVILRGQVVPIIGRVCMNMCMVDVTAVPDASVGDEVVLLGAGESAEAVAARVGTINYEITTRIHPRLPRRLI